MKAILYPAVSLDGFIAKPDGDSYTWVNQEDEQRYNAEVERCGCVLVGRTTYEEYLEDFQAREGVMTFICTKRTGFKDTQDTKFISGTPQEMLKTVEASGFKEVIICGGGEINGLFASAGLIDEIFISIQPVILGSGIPLFGSHKPELKLELLSSNEDVPGVTQLHYKVIQEDL